MYDHDPAHLLLPGHHSPPPKQSGQATGRVEGNAAYMLALQRQIGNRAVARLLDAREGGATLADPAPPHALAIQRSPSVKSVTSPAGDIGGGAVGGGVGAGYGLYGIYNTYKAWQTAKQARVSKDERGDTVSADRQNKEARTKLGAAAVHGVTSAKSVAGSIADGLQAGFAIAATSGAAISGAAASLTGGIAGAALSPIQFALSVFTAQKGIRQGIRGGQRKRNIFNMATVGKKWTKKKAELENELTISLPNTIEEVREEQKGLEDALVEARGSQKKRIAGALQRRQIRKMEERLATINGGADTPGSLKHLDVLYRQKREELALVEKDLAALPGLRDRLGEAKIKELKDEARGRSIRSTDDQDTIPTSLGQIQAYYWNQKKKAEWRGAVSGTGGAVSALGASIATAGAVLAICGAAGLGIGAVPGLVVVGVGAGVSLLGTALGAVPTVHQLYRGAMKKDRGKLRKNMAQAFMRIVGGRKPESETTPLGGGEILARHRSRNEPVPAKTPPSKNLDQLTAWNIMVQNFNLPGLKTTSEVSADVSSDETHFDPKSPHFPDMTEIVSEKFSSTRGG